LLIVSPVPQPSWLPSGRNSTYQTCADFLSHL